MKMVVADVAKTPRTKCSDLDTITWPCAALLCLAFFSWEGRALGQAQITAEKNCNVRIEGETFSDGEKVSVYKDVKGRSRKIAIVQISKSRPGKKAIGKVVAGQKYCGSLKGALVKGASGGQAGTSAGSVSLPRVDAQMLFGLLFLTSGGVHQRVTQTLPRLQLFGFELAADAYPLLFTGQGFAQKALGLGFRYRLGKAIPDIDVTAPDNDLSKSGKQQTTPTDVQFDIIVRIPYLNDSMTTEVRPVAYLSHSLQHTLSSSNGLARSPLRDIQYSGFGFGLKQRYQPMNFLRLNMGFMLPFALKGKVDNTTEQSDSIASTATVKTASGYMFDLSADYLFKMFKFSAGLQNTSYKSQVELSGGGTLAVSENYLFLYAGAGILL